MPKEQMFAIAASIEASSDYQMVRHDQTGEEDVMFWGLHELEEQNSIAPGEADEILREWLDRRTKAARVAIRVAA